MTCQVERTTTVLIPNMGMFMPYLSIYIKLRPTTRRPRRVFARHRTPGTVSRTAVFKFGERVSSGSFSFHRVPSCGLRIVLSFRSVSSGPVGSLGVGLQLVFSFWPYDPAPPPE